MNEGFSYVTPCKACEQTPTDRELYNIPLCSECKHHLNSTGIGKPSQDRINNYIDKQQKLRRRLL